MMAGKGGVMGRHRDLGQEMRLDEIHGWKIFPMKKTMLLTYQFLDVPCVSSLEAEFDEMTGNNTTCLEMCWHPVLFSRKAAHVVRLLENNQVPKH